MEEKPEHTQSMASRWHAVGQRMGTWGGTLLRYRPVLAGTAADRVSPCSAASRAPLREFSAHCPAPGSARARTTRDATPFASGRSVHNKRVRGMSSDSNSANDADQTHFGFQTVRSDEKAKLVGRPRRLSRVLLSCANCAALLPENPAWFFRSSP